MECGSPTVGVSPLTEIKLDCRQVNGGKWGTFLRGCAHGTFERLRGKIEHLGDRHSIIKIIHMHFHAGLHPHLSILSIERVELPIVSGWVTIQSSEPFAVSFVEGCIQM